MYNVAVGQSSNGRGAIVVAQLELTRGQELGQKIRTARRHMGFTQQHVADELGVHVVMVQRWEAGKHVPQMQYRRKLWGLLGLVPSDFDTDPPPAGGVSSPLNRGRELSTEGQARQPNDADTAHMLTALMGFVGRMVESAVNAAEIAHDALSPAEQLELAKELSMVRHELEKRGEHDLAEELRVVLAKQEYRAGRILVPLAMALGLYFANGGRDTAKQAIEAELTTLKLKSA